MQIDYPSIKKTIFLFIRTLSIYGILSVFLYIYLGLIDPGGSIYAPFLAKYNFIDLLLNALIYPVKYIMILLEYDIVSNGRNVSIAHEKGILIFHGCLGLDIMKAYVALILGYPARKKILFLFIGLGFIHALNIARILLILLTIKTNPSIVIQSHDVLNIVGYLCILIFYFFYINKYSK
jgi:exosortase/archaeosortase family protein